MKTLLAKLALCLATLPVALTAAASPVLLVGETAPVRVGDTFTVPIRITGATDLTAFQFDLGYDPLVLEAVGVSSAGTDFEAAALAGGGALTGLTGFLLPGLLSGVADSMAGVIDGLDGSGVLATVEFRAIGLGTASLSLSNAFVDFLPLPADAMVDGVAVVPEPGALWLAVLALGGLALQRRRPRPAAHRPASPADAARRPTS